MTSRTVRSMMVGTAMFPENVLHAEAKVENQELRNHMMENKLEKMKQEKVGLDQSQTALRDERKSASQTEHESASQNHWETADEYGQNLIQRPNKFGKPPKKQDKNPNNFIAASSKNCCGEDTKQNDCCTASDTERSSTNSEKTKSARSVGLRGSDDTKREISEGDFIITLKWSLIAMCYLIPGIIFFVLLSCYNYCQFAREVTTYPYGLCMYLDCVALLFQVIFVVRVDDKTPCQTLDDCGHKCLIPSYLCCMYVGGSLHGCIFCYMWNENAYEECLTSTMTQCICGRSDYWDCVCWMPVIQCIWQLVFFILTVWTWPKWIPRPRHPRHPHPDTTFFQKLSTVEVDTNDSMATSEVNSGQKEELLGSTNV